MQARPIFRQQSRRLAARLAPWTAASRGQGQHHSERQSRAAAAGERERRWVRIRSKTCSKRPGRRLSVRVARSRNQLSVSPERCWRRVGK